MISIYKQTDSLIGKIAEAAHSSFSQVSICLMTAVITLEVVFRYFFGAGFKWSQEVCGYCFLLLVFLCQANAWQEDRHIRMDIFYNKFGKGFKKFCNVLTIICGLILYLAIAYQGYHDIIYQIDVGEATEELMWPLWPFTTVIVFGSLATVLLLLRFSYVKMLRGE